MWTSLSISRWIFLLTLAVVMFFSVSQVDSFVPVVRLPCCRNLSTYKVHKIKECFEQKPRNGCNVHAFLIKGRRAAPWCIDPASEWLIGKIKKGELFCRADVSLSKDVDQDKL